MEKLTVTLEDRPVDIELAQYKRMFEAACSALAAIGDALGVDPEEGGAEPILAAIADLKASDSRPVKQEPMAFHRASFLSGYEAAQSDANSCDVPPQGWLCTRQAGHDGPCAAIADDKERELVNRAMLRLADQEAAPVQLVKQKPVAYMVKSEGFIYSLVNRISAAEEIVSMLRKDDQGAAIHPLYAAPVQQVDLTDEELEVLYDRHAGGWRVLFRAVIAAYKEKNK